MSVFTSAIPVIFISLTEELMSSIPSLSLTASLVFLSSATPYLTSMISSSSTIYESIIPLGSETSTITLTSYAYPTQTVVSSTTYLESVIGSSTITLFNYETTIVSDGQTVVESVGDGSTVTVAFGTVTISKGQTIQESVIISDGQSSTIVFGGNSG
jgi:hypothetical protein